MHKRTIALVTVMTALSVYQLNDHWPYAIVVDK